MYMYIQNGKEIHAIKHQKSVQKSENGGRGAGRGRGMGWARK
jgi:hypothetical protein